MKVPLSWLKEYVDVELDPHELAHRLTMAGVEAEGVELIGEAWEHVVVGRVEAVNPHPDADRLRLATVDTGSGTMTVVCGAPNAAAGQKIAFAQVGATLVDGHTGKTAPLKPAKIRGFESRGMVCSERELGLSDEHEGILVLPSDAPLGAPFAEYYGDAVIELSPTPNRPDCLSILGIAREVAAITGKAIREPSLGYPEDGEAASEKTSVEILDPHLCPRYIAGVVTGVTLGPSPGWMQERLKKCGMRPISNIVDITNYVMLEFGQPLHAFDYDLLEESRIVVRRAREEERMPFIDGQLRPLSPGMLAIADARRPVALAGVMGGAHTEVSGGTANILLESAAFNNTSIRRTSHDLGLRSEASSRFEKGLSADLPLHAARRAMQLIVQLAGGTACAGLVDAYPGRADRRPVRLTEERARRVLGMELPAKEMADILTSLGFDVSDEGSGALAAMPPYWRTDIAIEDDLIEEVARVRGYDSIPTTNLDGAIPSYEPQPMLNLKETLRDLLVRYDMTEVVTYPLTNPDVRRKAQVSGGEPLRILHPLSSEMEELRLTLRGGLLQTLAANQRHATAGIRLFEVARVYRPREADLPEEAEYLGAVLTGPRRDSHWQINESEGKDGNLDFFDAKGLLDAVLSHLGVVASYAPASDPLLHPGRTAEIALDGCVAGMVGELNPKTLRAFDLLNRTTVYVELELARLLPLMPQTPDRYTPFPRFPGLLRDLALVLDKSVAAERVYAILTATPLIQRAELFDVYTGDQVPAGKRSLAYRLTYQSPGRTLTSDEVQKVQDRLLQRLQREIGATIRD